MRTARCRFFVGLNHARAAEEATGRIRWLRPEFQSPDESTATGLGMEVPAGKRKFGSVMLSCNVF